MVGLLRQSIASPHKNVEIGAIWNIKNVSVPVVFLKKTEKEI